MFLTPFYQTKKNQNKIVLGGTALQFLLSVFTDFFFLEILKLTVKRECLHNRCFYGNFDLRLTKKHSSIILNTF